MKKHLTLSIDCSHTVTSERVHASIARQLHFPSYYGANLDALRDCLADILVEHSLSVVWKDTEHSKKDVGLSTLKKVVCDVVGVHNVQSV